MPVHLQADFTALTIASVNAVVFFFLYFVLQEYLHSHQNRPTVSFYDEMLIRKQLQEELIIQKKQEFQQKEVCNEHYVMVLLDS
jgi:hypothetical protein